jgi:hypothetical protein
MILSSFTNVRPAFANDGQAFRNDFMAFANGSEVICKRLRAIPGAKKVIRERLASIRMTLHVNFRRHATIH